MAGLGLLGAQRGVVEQALPALAFGGEVVELAAPLGVVPLELGEAALEDASAVAQAGQFALEAGELGAHRVQRALGLLHAFVGRELGLAGGFEAAFELLQVGRIGLDAAGRVGELVGQPRPLGPGLVALQEPQQVLALGLGGGEGAEFLGHSGLHLEAADLLAELVADVLEADQVVAGVGQAPFGLAATLAVFGDAGGLFEEAAHLFGPRLDDPRDHPLLDDRVGPRAQAGAEEQVNHVLAADLHPVDVIGGLAAAVEHALHRHLGVGLPLAGGAAFGVVEDQLDTGPRHRLAGGRAVEDHVLH